MVTENAQLEKQELEKAQEELKQAKDAFAEQLNEYFRAGKALIGDLQLYRQRRRFWLN